MGGQLGDLVTESIRFRNGVPGGSNDVPNAHSFRALPAPPGQAIGAGSANFRTAHVLAYLGVAERR
jgi:hypothetical protein